MPEAIAMCDQKTGGEPCKEPAALSYRWDWGQTGHCCLLHSQLLQQTGQNLSRGISLAPLGTQAEAPLERSERTQLIARALSAEAEADEIKARGAELYKQNVELTRQVQTMTLKVREANGALEVKDDRIEQLESKVDELQADLGTATDELQRLQLLANFTPTSDTQPGTGPLPSDG